jgi:hypothetical protein
MFTIDRNKFRSRRKSSYLDNRTSGDQRFFIRQSESTTSFECGKSDGETSETNYAIDDNIGNFSKAGESIDPAANFDSRECSSHHSRCFWIADGHDRWSITPRLLDDHFGLTAGCSDRTELKLTGLGLDHLERLCAN